MNQSHFNNNEVSLARPACRRARALLPIGLLVIAACSSPEPIFKRLESRLRSFTESEMSPDEIQQALTRQLRTTRLPAKSGKGSPTPVFPTRETLTSFYAGNGHKLAWCDDYGKALPSTATLLDAIKRAEEHGLEPENYALSKLELLAGQLDGPPEDDAAVARVADFDLLMTAAFFRYASDLSTGRVHPDEIKDDWHSDRPELDLPMKLNDALKRNDLARLLESFPPPHEGYGRLRDALKKLRESGPGAESPEGRSVESRIRQIELNLERYRWIPRKLGDPHVLVNIPAFDLALVRGGVPVWRTRIVVGKSFTPTPIFSDRIVTVVVNPPWNVPESIAVGEYVPELRENPRALTKHGLRLFEGTGEDAREVNPAKIDWDDVEEGDFPYHMRQDPGPESALGRLKFHLTNEFNIYLHDTPARSLFVQEGRDLSHGCIRVENPLKLAEQILDESSRNKMRESLEETEEHHIPVNPDVPLHILYITAWVDDSGTLQFSPDVYELDRAQRLALDRVASRPLGGAPGSGPSAPALTPAR